MAISCPVQAPVPSGQRDYIPSCDEAQRSGNPPQCAELKLAPSKPILYSRVWNDFQKHIIPIYKSIIGQFIVLFDGTAEKAVPPNGDHQNKNGNETKPMKSNDEEVAIFITNYNCIS